MDVRNFIWQKITQDGNQGEGVAIRDLEMGGRDLDSLVFQAGTAENVSLS